MYVLLDVYSHYFEGVDVCSANMQLTYTKTGRHCVLFHEIFMAWNIQ